MEPSEEFRRKYVARGRMEGAQSAKKKFLHDLEMLASEDDLEWALQELIQRIRTEVNGASSAATTGAPDPDDADRALALIERARATEQKDDLVDRTAAAMGL